MTATFVVPNSNSIMNDHPLISSSSTTTLSTTPPTIMHQRRRQLPPPPPPLSSASASLIIPTSSKTAVLSPEKQSHHYLQQQQHDDDEKVLPSTRTSDTTTTSAAATTTNTTITTTQHHDIFISLTSPTMMKKKKTNVVNNDTIEFNSNVSSNNNSNNTNSGKGRCLTPASVQLLRNSLLLTNNGLPKNIIRSSRGNTQVRSSSSNSKNSIGPLTNDSNETTRTIYNYHYHQQQQQQQKCQNRTLKRLNTEPIPTSKLSGDMTCSSNIINNTNSSTTTSPQQPPPRRRRQIFGSFWDTTTTTTTPPPPTTTSTSVVTNTENKNVIQDQQLRPTTRIRANSCFCVETVMEASTTASMITTGTKKPPSHHIRSKSDGVQYSTGDDDCNETNHYHRTILFSSLPSPMQRLRKTSGGVYPLIQPKSILRNKDYPSRTTSDNDNVIVNVPLVPPVRHDDQKDTQFSKTGIQHTVPDDGSSTITDFDRSSSISSSNNSIPSIQNGNAETNTTATSNNNNNITRKPLVHFDPRITITELIGRDHHRVWYSDCELNRFKYETVVTARAYFSQHPDQIMYYNKPFYDPVTKTMRKRALFNLPVLSNIAITDEDDHGLNKVATDAASSSKGIDTKAGKVQEKTPPSSSENRIQQVHQQLLSQLAFEGGDTIPSTANLPESETNSNCHDSSTIRSVLIVDHNQWILDLFVRSVKTMFNSDGKGRSNNSSVIVESAPNVSVAMAIIKDAIESQQRHPPFDLIIAEQISLPLLQQTQLLQQQQSSLGDTIDGTVIGDTTATSISGAELLFHQLPQEYRDQMLLISVAPSPFSMSSNHNNKVPNATTTTSAATNTIVTTLSDFVWNKPPPRMDNNLRIQLIRTLQKKRETKMCS